MVNHMAAKTIENVCSRESQCGQGFITAEVGPALWYLFTHSTVDALRVSAISVSITHTDVLSSLTQNILFTFWRNFSRFYAYTPNSLSLRFSSS